MSSILNNITWSTLSGQHSHFATGNATVQRYAVGFSPIVGFPEPRDPDFDALVAFCDVDEQIYCPDWTGALPRGWRIHIEKQAYRMVWHEDIPQVDVFPEAVSLGPKHAAQAAELARITNPGPFGLRTIELGDYFGWFEDGRLVAMAGERMYAKPYREVSGICTHPDFRGHGLARRLTQKLIRRQMLRGEIPFLHVMADNTAALRLYREMGFSVYRETVLRVISRHRNSASYYGDKIAKGHIW